MPDSVDPPSYPPCPDHLLETVRRQLTSRQWVRLEGCPELEDAWKKFQGTEHTCWFLSSGTAAIQAALLGHGIAPGDHVLVPPYTWGATVSAVLGLGAIPVFADIEYESGQMDAGAVRAALSADIKAVIAVHLFGIPAPVDALRQIADEHGIPLVEDASQAHGARLRGRRVGNFGHASAFSCMGLKPLGATEGGMVQFEDPAAAEIAFLYGKHPRGIEAERRQHLEEQGLLDTLQFGWRPSPLSAAILQARLPDLDKENEARRRNARLLRERLRDIPGLRLPEDPEGTEPVYHLLSFLPDEDLPDAEAGRILARAREENLPLFRYIPVPIHHMKRLNPSGYEGPPVLWHAWLRQAGIDYSTTRYPQAERRAARSLEMAWNWIEEDPAAMDRLSDRFAAALRPYQ